MEAQEPLDKNLKTLGKGWLEYAGVRDGSKELTATTIKGYGLELTSKLKHRGVIIECPEIGEYIDESIDLANDINDVDELTGIFNKFHDIEIAFSRGEDI